MRVLDFGRPAATSGRNDRDWNESHPYAVRFLGELIAMFSAFGFTRRGFISGVAVLAVVSAAMLVTPRATAQTAVEAAKVAAEINRVASNLPPESRDVITRLTMLRELPGGSWKMHGG